MRRSDHGQSSVCVARRSEPPWPSRAMCRMWRTPPLRTSGHLQRRMAATRTPRYIRSPEPAAAGKGKSCASSAAGNHIAVAVVWGCWGAWRKADVTVPQRDQDSTARTPLRVVDDDAGIQFLGASGAVKVTAAGTPTAAKTAPLMVVLAAIRMRPHSLWSATRLAAFISSSCPPPPPPP